MLTPEQIATFRREGFVLGPRVIDDEALLVELREEVLRVIRDRDDAARPQPVRVSNLGGNPDRPVWQIVNIWMASPPFEQLMQHPTILEDVARLTDAAELRIWHDQIQYKPAAQGGVNMWHQDSPLWPPLAPKDRQVTAWIALDDVDEGNGCMSMVPGSHQWGVAWDDLRELSDYDALPAQYRGNPVTRRLCPVERGRVHYHHALTWHGSHANTSDRPRRAIALHYMTEQTRLEPSQGHHLMIDLPHDAAPGEKLRGGPFRLLWSAP